MWESGSQELLSQCSNVSVTMMGLLTVVSDVIRLSITAAYNMFLLCIRPQTSQNASKNNDTSQPAKSPCVVCKVDDALFYCRQNGHGFCHECINVYALGEFQKLGSYCRLVPSTTSTEISQIGELPCPFFERDGCPCKSLKMSHCDWNTETLNAFRQADRRINVLQAADAHERHHNVQREKVQNNNPDDLMRQAVQNILSIGASVRCPNCGYRGVKDGACMHIRCENCRCSWCYCCGRCRGRGSNLCSACDQLASHIQSHRGWGTYQVEPSETQGYGALHEFHRKRMCYFLRRLVEGVPDLPWSDFWTRNQQMLLTQVPTPKRQITLEDIANASPPYFPPSTVDSLQWLNDCQPIIDSLSEQSRRCTHDAARTSTVTSTNRQPFKSIVSIMKELWITIFNY
jgi:hypothetical protein